MLQTLKIQQLRNYGVDLTKSKSVTESRTVDLEIKSRSQKLIVEILAIAFILRKLPFQAKRLHW